MKLTYELLLEKINKEIPFAFSRYGDGEWFAIFEKKNTKNPNEPGANCDNHKFFPDMGEALRNVLKSKPEYFLGMQNLALRTQGDRIGMYLEDNKLELEWGNADILHHANIKTQLKDFFEVLKTKSILLIAPERLKGINKYFSYNYFVEVPQVDCWLDKKRILYEISKILNRKKGYIVILFCASMAANVWIDLLYNQDDYKDFTCMIDAGSIFEPFVGVKIRSYHHNMKIDEPH